LKYILNNRNKLVYWLKVRKPEGAIMDKYNEETRSYIMSRVRSKNTKPEILVRKILFSYGFRFRNNVKTLPGKPDIVLPKYKTIIFVHGCFWHGHENCKHATIPETRREWWIEKINANKNRDAQNIMELKQVGWSVMVIWACALKKTDSYLYQLIDSIRENVQN
jgi:DNA mismatch endonuclease (patch repair protein)